MREPVFLHTDQLRSNCATDQHLSFHHIDSSIPHISKSEISRFQPSYVAVQPDLYPTWSETQADSYNQLKWVFLEQPKSSSTNSKDRSSPNIYMYNRNSEAKTNRKYRTILLRKC